MKIVIISDIHDNLVNLHKCLNWCKKEKIDKIICCGDLTNSETLKALSQKFDGEVLLVRGNIEIYKKEEIEKYNNIKYFGKVGRFNMSNKIVGICHEPFLINKILEKGKVDFLFYGHTHKPWTEDKDGVQIFNPGTLGGVFQKATFAIWNVAQGRVELKLLESI